MVAIVVAIVIAVPVPAMVVGNVAMVAIPVAIEVTLSVMMWFHPVRAAVCRTSPISVVPLVVAAHGVPIPADPGIAFARAAWLHPDHTNRRWRSDSNPDGDLRKHSSGREQRQYHQFCFHDSKSLPRYSDGKAGFWPARYYLVRALPPSSLERGRVQIGRLIWERCDSKS